MAFNRHAYFTGKQIRGRVTFLNTGSDLILAAAFLYGKTGRSRYRDWAWRMAKCYDDVRDRNTGLGPYMFARPVHGGGVFGEAFGPDYNETNIEQYGYRFTYFDFILFYVSTLFGDAAGGEDLRRWAVQDLKAYRTYGYDGETDAFYAMLCTRTGRRLTPRDLKDAKPKRLAGSHYYARRGPWFLARLLRSYVYGYQLTKDEQLLDAAGLVLRLVNLDAGETRADAGSTRASAASPTEGPADFVQNPDRRSRTAAGSGETAASMIQALIDLYAATGDQRHLARARALADEAIETLSHDGLLLRTSGDKVCWINQRLPLALIRLQCVLSGVRAGLAPDLGGTIRPTGVR